MPTVFDIYKFIDKIAPFADCEEWDNCGLLVGERHQTVNRVLVALDITSALIDEAVKKDCNLIVTHHPIIFKAQKSFAEDNLAYRAAKNKISVITAHTSLDRAIGGVNDILCKAIGLQEVTVCSDGLLRIGICEAQSAEKFAKAIKSALHGSVRCSDVEKPIRRVAVCSGSGSDFLPNAKQNGADALLTGDAGHHAFLDAKEMGVALFAAGHFETEVIAAEALAEKLQNAFPQTEILFSNQTSPIKEF